MSSTNPNQYNTGNPVPSNVAKDLSDNARVFDVMTTSTEYTEVVDRLGKTRLTFEGFEKKASELMEQYGLLNKGNYLPNPVLLPDAFSFVVGPDGESFFAVNPPYTTQPAVYADPKNDPNLKIGSYVTNMALRTYQDKMMGYVSKGSYLPSPVTLTNDGDYVLDDNGDRWFAIISPHTTDPTAYPTPSDDPNLKSTQIQNVPLTVRKTTASRYLVDILADKLCVEDFASAANIADPANSDWHDAIISACNASHYPAGSRYRNKVIGVRTYKSSPLNLPEGSVIDLSVSPINNNTPFILLNNKFIDLTTTELIMSGYASTVINVDSTSPDFVNANGFKFEDIVINDSNPTTTSRVMNVNLTQNSYISFWVAGVIRAGGIAKGVTVVSNANDGDSTWFNDNTFSLYLYDFIDEPLVLDARSGNGKSEVSANNITVSLQPTGRTTDGVKIYGGLRAARNKIDGEIWDWVVDALAVYDRGWKTIIRDIADANVQMGLQAKIEVDDPRFGATRHPIVPSGNLDRSFLGQQDNYIAFADQKSKMTVTNSAVSSGTMQRLLSNNCFDSTAWSVSSPTDYKTITIEWDDLITIDHATVTGYTLNNPRYVKIEYKNQAGDWLTLSEQNQNYQPVCGYISSYAQSNGPYGLGVRYTFGDPINIGLALDRDNAIELDEVRLCNLFVGSNTVRQGGFLPSFRPILSGGIGFDATLKQVPTTIIDCVPAYDADGNYIGRIPIYQ